MLKTIQKLISQAALNGQTKQYIQLQITQIEPHCKTTADLIIAASNVIMKRAASSIQNQEYSLSASLLNICRELLLRNRNEDTYSIHLIKIRFFILTIKLSQCMKIQESLVRRIKLFLQTIQSNSFYPLIQEDFYSHIQTLYLEGIKAYLKEGLPEESLKMIKQCFITLKRQILALIELMEASQDQKIKAVMEKKGKTLESLFYLQYGTHLLNSQQCPAQVIANIAPSYDKLLKKIQFEFDPQQLIKRNTYLPEIKRERQQSLEDSTEEQNQEKKRCSIQIENKRRLTKETISEGILKSLQFVEEVQIKSRFSSLHQSSKQRISLKMEEKLDGRKNIRGCKGNQSRFYSCSLQKENSKLNSQILSSQTSDQKSNTIEFKTKKVVSLKQHQPRRTFSLVERAEEEERKKLKQMNPFKEFKQSMVAPPSSAAMIKNGIVSMGLRL